MLPSLNLPFVVYFGNLGEEEGEMECPACRYRFTLPEVVALLVSDRFRCPNCGYPVTEDAQIQAERVRYYQRERIAERGFSGRSGQRKMLLRVLGNRLVKGLLEWRDFKTMNTLKTTLWLAGLTGLFIGIGKLLGGMQGMVIAFVLAVLMNVGSYWFSDKIVLGMYRAREVSPAEAPRLFRIVQGLAEQAGLPLPRLYILPQPILNAFATGRDPQHAAVAVTAGLLNTLEEEELKGVLAHELAHIKNRDTLLSTLAATLAGAITMVADMARWATLFGGLGASDDEERGSGLLGALVLMIVAPIAALLIQFAISRSREFLADSTGAQIAGTPFGLANALRKLEYAAQARPTEVPASTAHLFIVNPLRSGGLLSLFSTHPPTAARIARLEALIGRI